MNLASPNARARPLSRARAFGRAVALIAAAGLVGSVLGVTGGSDPAHAAPADQVRGLVFIDFDGDGVFDTGNGAQTGIANDAALAGATVTAHRVNGTTLTATSAATITGTGAGAYNYTIAGLAANEQVRIEFGLPAGHYESFARSGATSTRFVQAGADVHLGVIRPDDYNPGNPFVVTMLQRPGSLDPASSDASIVALRGEPAVVMTPWSVANNSTTTHTDVACTNGTQSGCSNFTARTRLATLGQVGSVYAGAYDAPGRDLYVAATYKRGSDLGPLGLGGIYRINDIVTPAGAAGTPTVENWLNVAAAPLNINVGTAENRTQRALGASSGRTADRHAFENALRVGIGGMAVDTDRGLLYFVNLFDKKIYAITLDGKALVGSWTTPASLAGTTRVPFALALRGDSLYVGYADTGEAYPFCPAATPGTSRVNGATGGCSGATQQLQAYAARAPLSASGAPGTFSTVLTIPLGSQYVRGNQMYDWHGQGATHATANPQVLRWNTWTNAWSITDQQRSVSFLSNGNWGAKYMHTYPQAFVASLSFHSDGFLTIGMGDRTQIQSGNRQVAAVATPGETTYETITVADTLLAAPSGSGSFALESNGNAGGRAVTHTTRQPDNEGIGGREYYYDRANLGTQTNHYEASLGATISIGGVQQVASTFMDPLGAIRVTGLGWFDTQTGRPVRGYQHENDTGDLTLVPSFQKGGGIGGLAAVVSDAPVEIGNRVWYDADLDGIQDPDEPAINGAPVQLWRADAAGEPVELLTPTPVTTSTRNGQAGLYYFVSEDAPPGTPDRVVGFTKEGDYVVVFPKPTLLTTAVDLQWPASTTTAVRSMFTGMTWAQLRRTVANAAADASDVNDSDADPVTGRAPVTVGISGQNDHRHDAGWYGMGGFSVEKTTTGLADPDAEYTVRVATAVDFRGTSVLGAGGPATEPRVDVLTAGVEAGERIAWAEEIPYGTTLTLREDDMPDAAVAFTPNAPAGAHRGSVVITPTAVAGGQLLQVRNAFATLQVAKTLDGASVPAGTTFTVEYEAGVTTAEAEVAAGGTVVLEGVPVGGTVRLREPIVGPSSGAGLVWGDPVWRLGANVLTQDADGWVEVVIPNQGGTVNVSLENRAWVPPALPFAGGLAQDAILIAGGLVTLVAFLLGVVQLRRRMRALGS